MHTQKSQKNYGMEIITTEEVMNMLDMFQSRQGKTNLAGGIWKIFYRFRYSIYLHGVPQRMSNPQCSFYASISGASVNAQTSQSDMQNIAYDRTPTYGTCTSFGRIYSCLINVYSRSYLPVIPKTNLINKYREPTTPLNLNQV